MSEENNENKRKTQLTIQEWIRETNLLAVLTLFLLSILAATFSIQNKDFNSVDLRLVRNATSTRFASKLNVGAVFVMAIFFQLLGHAIIAWKAPIVENMILNNDKLDSRALCLILSFPLLHAAVLVGVAQVADSWAVFASFLMTFLILILMFIFEKGGKRSKLVQYITVFVVLVLYVAFWILAWKSGAHSKIRRAQLGGFNCGVLLLLVIYFIALRNTSARIRALSEKKQDGDSVNEKCYAIVLQQEAIYVCITVGFAMVAVTTWICYTSSENPGRKVAIAVSISALLQLLLCVSITQRLRYVVFDKNQLKQMRERLLHQESIYITNTAAQIGIDSDSDTDKDSLNLVVPS